MGRVAGDVRGPRTAEQSHGAAEGAPPCANLPRECFCSCLRSYGLLRSVCSCALM